MVLQIQHRTSRHPSPLSSDSFPQATERKPSQLPIRDHHKSNVNTLVLAPSSSSLIQVECSEDGTMRFKHSDTNRSTLPPPAFEASIQAPKQFAESYPWMKDKNHFAPFGIPAERTQAKYKEICPLFVTPSTRCYRGFRCHRIHPHDKKSYLQKIRGALAVGDSASPPQDKPEKQSLLAPDILESLLLSNSDKPSSTICPPLTSDHDGWSTNGSWNSISKAESWTTSPATSNDPLLSPTSGSSSSTITTPEASDDDKETPTTATRRHPTSAVCAMFKRKGTCLQGKNCMFKHIRDMPELVATQITVPPIDTTNQPPPSMAPTRPATPATSVSNPHTKAVLPPRSRHPRPPTNELCHRWLRNVCQYGSACRFIHGDLDYDVEPAGASPSVAEQSSLTRSSKADASTSVAEQSSLIRSSKADASPSVAEQSSSTLTKQLGTMDDGFLLYFTIRDHMRVQCSAGFDIQRIQTAFESSTLLVSNISPRVRPAHLKETLSSYGVVEELRMPAILSINTIVKVTYSDATEAQKAQNALNGKKMYDLTITARVANSGNTLTATNAILKDTSIRINWEAPAKEVFAGYSTKEQAERALQISRDTPLNGHYLRGGIYEGMPAVDNANIRFRGVPVDVDKADLVRFVNPVDIMWTRPNYTDLDAAVTFVKNHLRGFGPESIDVLPPPYRDGGMVRAYATFPNASKAREAARYLDGRRPKCIGFTPIRATHVQSLSYTLNPEQWARLGPAIDALQFSLRGKLVGLIVAKRDSGFRNIRLSGDDQKELAHLKNQFEKVLKGEIVRCDGKIVYDSYFTRREGEEFLKDLGIKNPAIHFVNDVQRQRIHVYGYSVDRARFMNAVVTKVKELRSQKQLEIPLPGFLLGAAIKDKALRDLRHKYGLDNCYIDVPRRLLRIRGDFGLYRKFKSVVDEIAQRLPRTIGYTGPACPICFGEPSSPIRLQCGHIWCRDCISHYFRSTTEQKAFPTKCLGNEGRCGTKIPIGVAKEVLTGHELEAIVEAAFLAHIYTRPREFHFCPSPDCPQVYRTTQQKATLQCPSCLTSICTRCHSQAHDEFQCADQVQDELFRKWIQEHDVKHCPSCDTPIEKIEGCNHMTCTRCQTHICWQCMKTFPGGEGIYGHMREVHGTFGLAEVFV